MTSVSAGINELLMPGGEPEASPRGAGWRWGGEEHPRAAAPQRPAAPCPPPAPPGVDWLLSLVSIANLCAGAARAAFIHGRREGRSPQPGRISAGGYLGIQPRYRLSGQGPSPRSDALQACCLPPGSLGANLVLGMERAPGLTRPLRVWLLGFLSCLHCPFGARAAEQRSERTAKPSRKCLKSKQQGQMGKNKPEVERDETNDFPKTVAAGLGVKSVSYPQSNDVFHVLCALPAQCTVWKAHRKPFPLLFTPPQR